MTTMTPTRLAQMPRVNLLPPEIAASCQAQATPDSSWAHWYSRSWRWWSWYSSMVTGQVSGAEDGSGTAEAEGNALAADVATYAEVPQVLAEVDVAQANLVTAMTPEIRWSFYLNDLSLTIPNSTRLVSTTAVNEAAAAQLSGTVDTTGGVLTPLGQASMGSVTFSGRSTSFDAVAAWLQSLARQKGYVEPTVQSVIKAEGTDTAGSFYDTETSTQLSLEAASERFLTIANGE